MATNKIAIRRDTAAGWTAADPTLAAGEFALETDSHKLKNGDGATAYTSLGYLRPINAVTVTGNHTVASNEDVINVNAASATITLPAADVIGRRVTVRKISASAGTVTVSRASTDTITRATLTSVTLTSNGDFWTLEVVASGRWDLVDGYESSISGEITVRKEADGTITQTLGETTAAIAVTGVAQGAGVMTLDSAFDLTQPWAYQGTASPTVDWTNFSHAGDYQSAGAVYVTIFNTSVTQSMNYSVWAQGRWYA